ncbi:NUDIX hydrolase domain-like protein [Ephemerocybe angulata]|uniref:NUDIX hydrolase domain-like protein n=1 Tax=Ephemerocybe angulata TaxID=980116 RepID=A0A8H6HQX3_9AGAR|nr:NUDIX hydrolase domain-like protein [Tulosesus angulatus]
MRGTMSTKKSQPYPGKLLDFHRPKRRLQTSQIPVLTEDSKRCLRNLANYETPKQRLTFPRSRLAAVLVALFVGRKGDLYVLLSRRSSSLRTYAGDTSLPGGKVDPEDNSIEDTARREAFEEIGLPRDKLKVPLLCVLEPFLAAELIVIPVVVLILDKSLTPLLNQAEVDSLFSHPLASFLSTTPPFPSEPDTLEFEYHTFHDYDYAHSPGARKDKFRAHSFLTGREAGGVKPVFGLTAAMLIRTATIGYGREPSFEVHAPGSPSTEERIAWALLTRKVFVDACEKEGVDLTVARRIAGMDDQGSRMRLRERSRKQVRSKL